MKGIPKPHACNESQLLSSDFWLQRGLDMIGRTFNVDNEYIQRIYKSHYGCSPVVVMKCWSLIEANNNLSEVKGLKPAYLLRALLFLKSYETEHVLATIIRNATEKTNRKWIWIMVEFIASLEDHVVSLFSLISPV
jgi:hypothetical protein